MCLRLLVAQNVIVTSVSKKVFLKCKEKDSKAN